MLRVVRIHPSPHPTLRKISFLAAATGANGLAAEVAHLLISKPMESSSRKETKQSLKAQKQVKVLLMDT
jgi:hypothetical protein